MSLNEKLRNLKEAGAARRPAEISAVMQRSTAALVTSGILQQVAAVGEPAPDFVLPDAGGSPVDSRELRQRGPIYLSFYRGVW